MILYAATIIYKELIMISLRLLKRFPFCSYTREVPATLRSTPSHPTRQVTFSTNLGNIEDKKRWARHVIKALPRTGIDHPLHLKQVAIAKRILHSTQKKSLERLITAAIVSNWSRREKSIFDSKQ